MEAWAPIFGGFGKFFVFVINFSPIPGFVNLWKTQDFKMMSQTFFVLNNLCSVLWLSMGLVKNVPDIVQANIMGMIFTLSYLSIYHIVKKDFMTFMLGYLAVIASLFGLLVTFVPGNFLEAGASLVNTLMVLAPLEQVKYVLAEKDSRFIDMYIISIALPTSFCWMMFGVCIGSIGMILPNAVGVLSCSTLTVLYFIFRGGRPKDK